MFKVIRQIFPLLIFVFLFPSCLKDKNPLKYSDISAYSFGKTISDFGSYVILKPDGTLWSWGKNWNGELGHGTEESINIPTQINSISNIIDFDLSGGMCLAADANGHIWFWGSNMYSCLMCPKVLSPRKISFLTNIYKIYSSGFLIRNDGTIWKIEIDPQVNSAFYAPKRIEGMTEIISISGSFALRNDGTLLELMPSKDPEWGGFVSVQDVAEIQNSTSHTVILKRDNTVWAWGQNSIGELGNGTLEQSAEPIQVTNLNHVIQISTNYHFNLALKDDGSVWFWGFTIIRDENDNPVGINVPVRVDDLDNVIYIHANSECMIIKNDSTYWSFKVSDRIAQEIDIL